MVNTVLDNDLSKIVLLLNRQFHRLEIRCLAYAVLAIKANVLFQSELWVQLCAMFLLCCKIVKFR